MTRSTKNSKVARIEGGGAILQGDGVMDVEASGVAAVLAHMAGADERVSTRVLPPLRAVELETKHGEDATVWARIGHSSRLKRLCG